MAKTIVEAWTDTLDVADTRDIELMLDPEKCPREFLGYLAYFLGDPCYTTILGEEYERKSIADAPTIQSLIGTEEAANMFAKNVGVLHTIEYVYQGSGTARRLVQIVICVNQIEREIEGSRINFLQFLERTYKSLFWETININRVDVCPHRDLSIQVVAARSVNIYYNSE